ncbi:MAG TPA: SGNH/GDSL hydrolase family protein [Parafilimonas sp.]|nr:SGNH/GDSL hydrolase family protein [Parafilimonas sp.]
MKNCIFFSLMLLLFFKAHTQNCVEPFHIVILGSSTAAGDGVTDITKSWAYMYTEYLKAINPNYVVDNLAVAGTTTYDAQANDYTPPPGRPKPRKGHNISAAIQMHANAIIINYPSNDVSNYYTVTEQEENLKRITTRAANHNILVWVTTTQPRNFFSAKQVKRQNQVYAWVMSYYGNKAIDFQTGLASSVDSILYQYDSGDGIHLDNAAHKKLYNRVVKEHIPDSLCARLMSVPIAEEIMSKPKFISHATY